MKAFIIYLPSREHSVAHSQRMLAELQSYNIDAELFEGVAGDVAVALAQKSNKTLYPYSIKNRAISFDELKPMLKAAHAKKFEEKYHFVVHERQLIDKEDQAKLSRPGVVGCFYSHYRLWEKCLALNENIMIFEDDVKFYRNYEPVEFEGVLILSLGKSSFLGDPYKTYLEDPSGLPRAVPWKNFSMPGASGYAITPRAAQGLVKFYKNYWYPADNAINKFICPMYVHNYIMGRNTLPEEGNVSMTKFKNWIEE